MKIILDLKTDIISSFENTLLADITSRIKIMVKEEEERLMFAKEDRISSLPDELLLEIMSRIKTADKGKTEERLMSTKEVIQATCTISKRWQRLWTRLPTLVFIDRDMTKHSSMSYRYITDFSSFINQTLTQCPTDASLKRFKLQMLYAPEPASQVNSLLRYAITRNVQEIDFQIVKYGYDQSIQDELFFNNSCLVSIKLSLLNCSLNPPNGHIRWDKLKFLCIYRAKLDADLIGKILSGSPCLDTLELKYCYIPGRIPKSLFTDFRVLESLASSYKNFKMFRFDEELFLNTSYRPISLKVSHRVSNTPNAIRWDKLKLLCIYEGKLDESQMEKILSECPCLETLKLHDCCGLRRINVTSKSVENLILSNYGDYHQEYMDTLEINAPYISSLSIKGNMYLEKFRLENVSSLVKADLNFLVAHYFAKYILGRERDEIEDGLLKDLLLSLGHVNEITLGNYNCLKTLSRLEATGFQFPKGSDLPGSSQSRKARYQVFSLAQK